MFGILGWIVFGLIVGVIAKLVMPGRDPGGMLVTIALGIAGAVVGGPEAGLVGVAVGHAVEKIINFFRRRTSNEEVE